MDAVGTTTGCIGDTSGALLLVLRASTVFGVLVVAFTLDLLGVDLCLEVVASTVLAAASGSSWVIDHAIKASSSVESNRMFFGEDILVILRE